MYHIHQLNAISKKGTELLTQDYALTDKLEDSDAVLVRSANMHELTLPENLLAIARAGAGVNNIPLTSCADQGIVVFNTPGANANSVMELALCGMLLGSRDIVDGINWVQTIKDSPDVAKLVEKGKSRFAGSEIRGKNLGVIGLGAIGGLVANVAVDLGMNVIGCDPFLSVEGAWNLDNQVNRAATYDEIYEKADYITLHVPATKDTKGMINEATLATMKDGVRILNFARGDLVDSAAIIDALGSGKVAAYVTDFPSDEVIGVDGVIAIPHLGASTPESEENCAVMAADEIREYLENGNIVNSVNMPNVVIPRSTAVRVCIIHNNIPNMIAQISSAVSACNINIEKLNNQSRKDFAYSILDVESIDDAAIEGIKAIDGVIRVRVIK